jgi:hypothetical protein
MGLEIIDWRPLEMHVLAVAVKGSIGDCAAYIYAVPGQNHEKEAQLVAEKGNKLPREVAEVLFPRCKHLIWRG